jgi:hypothetical protein
MVIAPGPGCPRLQAAMTEPALLALSAGDILPFCMVALLSFALGMISTILFVMARSGSSHPNSETDLLEKDHSSSDKDDMETAGDHPNEAPPRESWERNPNWWKR